MLAFGAVAAVSVAAQGVSGDSPTLDVLYFLRCGFVVGAICGIFGMTLRRSPLPATRRAFVRAVLGGWIFASAACAAGVWRGWPHALTTLAMISVSVCSEPLAKRMQERAAALFDRATNRVLPSDEGGSP